MYSWVRMGAILRRWVHPWVYFNYFPYFDRTISWCVLYDNERLITWGQPQGEFQWQDTSCFSFCTWLCFRYVFPNIYYSRINTSFCSKEVSWLEWHCSSPDLTWWCAVHICGSPQLWNWLLIPGSDRYESSWMHVWWPVEHIHLQPHMHK